MTDAIETNLGHKPAQLSADSGYCSEANLAALETRTIDSYVATGRAREPPLRRTQLSRPKRRRALRLCARRSRPSGHESPYRLRKQLPEPVFGQIKQARGFRPCPMVATVA